MDNLVRMVSWVTSAQKAKVQKASKEAKKKDGTVTESAIVRKLIDKM